MGQPFVDASGPLLQIQGRKRWAIDLLTSASRISRTSPSVWLTTRQYGWLQSRRRRNCIHIVVFLIEDIFQGNGRSSPGGHQAEPKRMRRIGQKEVIGYFFQENQMRHGE